MPAPVTPDAPPPPPPPGLGVLLITAARMLDELAQAQVNREAGARVARPALMRLIPYLEEGGIRPSELARRADVTKQAVTQSLRTCEALGLVEFAPDPSDGRAQLVRLTDGGQAAVRYGQSVLGFLEGELARRVGVARVRELVAGLGQLLPVLEEWTARGAPTRPATPEAVALGRRFRR